MGGACIGQPAREVCGHSNCGPKHRCVLLHLLLCLLKQHALLGKPTLPELGDGGATVMLDL